MLRPGVEGPQHRVQVARTETPVALGTDTTATCMHADTVHDARALHDHMTAGVRIASSSGTR